MKKIVIFLIVCLAMFELSAQAPMVFNYQAVARNSSGVSLNNQSLSFRVSLLQGSANGTIVYSEVHNVTSNQLGLVNLKIGLGASTGNLSNVDWAAGPYFLKTEMDPNGGVNYILMGTSELLSVPYALYAESSGENHWEKTNSDIHYMNGNVGIGINTPSESLEINGRSKMDGMIIGNESLLPSHAQSDVKIVSNSNALDAVLVKHPGSGLNSSLGALNNRDIRMTMGVGGSNRSQVFQANWAFLKTADNLSFSSVSGLAIGHSTSSAPIVFMQNSQEKIRIDANGDLGIGTNNPRTGLHVSNEDIYIDDATKGVIMKSPNGQCWRMTVDNSGSPVFTLIPCP